VSIELDTVSALWEHSSGLDLLRAWADGRLPIFAHAARMGERILAVEAGRLEMSWLPGPDQANLAGAAHGGYICTVLDDASGLSVATLGDRFRPSLTLDLRVEFLRPALIGVTHSVTGTVVHHGRTRTVADAAISSPDGKLVARASGSFVPNRSYDPR
jgi:uncharacterized protein (TIGR00369 family)